MLFDNIKKIYQRINWRVLDYRYKDVYKRQAPS